MDSLPKTGLYSHDITSYLLAAEELKIPPNQNFLNVLTDNVPYCDLNGLDDVNVEAVCRILKTNTFIKSFKLSNGIFTVAGMAHLSDAIGANTILCRLDLSGCAIGVAGAKALGERLGTKGGGGAVSLEQLDLSNTQLGVEGLEAIIRALATLQNFQALFIEDNNLPAQAGLLIGKAIRSRPGLEEVYVGRNSLGDCGVAAIGGAIAADTRKGGRHRVGFQLRALDLSYNEVGCEGLSGLLRGLATLASITRASFHESNSQKDGSDSVHSGSTTSPPPCPLSILRLEGNLIADSGASKLADLLRQSGDFRIDELNLGSNRIGEDGVGALCSALGTNPPLTNLSLAGCQLGPTPLHNLGSMLSLNSRLTTLDISPSQTLQRTLADSAQLQRLHSAFSELVAGLEKNSVLTSLELGELKMILGRHAGLEVVKTKLASNQSLARVPKAPTAPPPTTAASQPSLTLTAPHKELSPMSAFPLSATPPPNTQPIFFPGNHCMPGPANRMDFSGSVTPYPQNHLGTAIPAGAYAEAQVPNDFIPPEALHRQQEQQALLAKVSSQLEVLLHKNGTTGKVVQNNSQNTSNSVAALQSTLESLQAQMGNAHTSFSNNQAQSFTATRSDNQSMGDQHSAIVPLEPIPSPDQVKRLAEQAAHKAVEKIYAKHLKVAEQMLATEVEKINTSNTKMAQELRWVDEEAVRKRVELEAKIMEVGGDLKSKIDQILEEQKGISERLDRVEQIVGLKNGEHLGSSDLQTLSLRIEKLEESVETRKQKEFEEIKASKEKDKEKLQKLEERLSQLEETCMNEQEANLKVLEALLEQAQKK